jgi:hypothetical protein
MNLKLVTAVTLGAFVVASAAPVFAQSGSLSPSGGMSQMSKTEPFADMNIDHTKKHNVNEWSEEQRAEVKRRCDHIASNAVDYQEQVHGFCTTHSSN